MHTIGDDLSGLCREWWNCCSFGASGAAQDPDIHFISHQRLHSPERSLLIGHVRNLPIDLFHMGTHWIHFRRLIGSFRSPQGVIRSHSPFTSAQSLPPERFVRHVVNKFEMYVLSHSLITFTTISVALVDSTVDHLSPIILWSRVKARNWQDRHVLREEWNKACELVLSRAATGLY